MDRVVGKLVLGGEAFVTRVRDLLDDKNKGEREHPREQRFVGRPTIDAVVRAVATHCQVEPRAIHAGHGVAFFQIACASAVSGVPRQDKIVHAGLEGA